MRVSQFFRRYQGNVLALFLLTQILLITLVGVAGWVAIQQLDMQPLDTYVVCFGLLLLLEILAAWLLISLVGKPLKILSQAIAHVSTDPIQTPPPELKQYEHSDLKNLVQTVYDLAVAAGRDKTTANMPLASGPIAAVFQNAPCGIVGLNATGEVVIANHLAPTHASADGKTELSLLFEQSDSFEAWLTTAVANKVRDTKRWRRIADALPGEDGRRIFDVVAYYNKNGQQNVEVVLVTVDRTADYAPDDEDMDFIAVAAHELRGPITVIRGYLDLLNEEFQPLNPDQQMLLDRLQVSAEQLSSYINNILNVSRYDRNHLRLHLRETPLIDVVRGLLPDLALRAKTRHRRLSFHIPNDLPTIAADAGSLSEVLSNLIDNAIKYSFDDGEIVVTATPKGNFVEITVRDFGIGIPEGIMGHLFSKFYRSHRSRQQVSGTGLGLYICKAIVESHGGSIWVRSAEGQGSTFGFTVPIYSAVADKLAEGDNENIIERSEGWIKNHALYRR